MDSIEKLQHIIDNSKKLVFFGGAGVSTESGIPDFRSADGLYNLKYKYPPEEIISHSFFVKNPEEFYRFYKDKMMCLEAQPNSAHTKLAEIERSGKDVTVVTQNIDGLHQKAGSKKVYELHGSIHRNHCIKCNASYNAEFVKNTNGVPKCVKCGGTVKPDVVLYEEGLDDFTVSSALQAISEADTLIVAGTSLAVYPAAGFIRCFNGSTLVSMNLTATSADKSADLVIHDKVGKVLSHIKV
ncbi:MAG: NAD-dependent protein deacylase [Ruminococcus sp.]|nr:NAD-dependent protein deacylase [Ruminococcus sp.]